MPQLVKMAMVNFLKIQKAPQHNYGASGYLNNETLNTFKVTCYFFILQIFFGDFYLF